MTKVIPELSRAQLAYVLSVAPASIAKLEAKGLPRAGGDDRRPAYDIRACVQWYVERQAEGMRRPAVSGQTKPLYLSVRQH